MRFISGTRLAMYVLIAGTSVIVSISVEEDEIQRTGTWTFELICEKSSGSFVIADRVGMRIASNSILDS